MISEMKQTRLDQLSDGIFAIVMTLLVIEIKIPEFTSSPTPYTLVQEFLHLKPLFLSYILAFTTLFTFWRAHHFIASVYVKNIDIHFTNINAIFFFFVALVPFSSHFLGAYNGFILPVLVFALNIIMIGISLFYMRNYASKSETIENAKTNDIQERHAHIRILFPVYASFLAIFICFFSINVALTVLTLAVLFNLLPSSTKIVDKLLGLK